MSCDSFLLFVEFNACACVLAISIIAPVDFYLRDFSANSINFLTGSKYGVTFSSVKSNKSA